MEPTSKICLCKKKCLTKFDDCKALCFYFSDREDAFSP